MFDSQGMQKMQLAAFFYPGGRGSAAPELGVCCLGLAPSVVAVALLLLLLPPPPPEAFASPIAGGEEDDDEEVVMVGAPCAGEVNVEEAAAVPSLGLAAEEEEAGAGVEVGRV